MKLPATKTFEQWAEEFAESMANGALAVVDAQCKSRGGFKAYQYVVSLFLFKVTYLLVSKALNDDIENPYLDQQDKYEDAVKNLSYVKLNVQEAVANAFQLVMSQFSGKAVEYYCEVKPVPEAANRKPI